MLANEEITQAKVEDLLAQLLECLERNAHASDPVEKPDCGQVIVLDVCMDGLRYTLTRFQPQPTHDQTHLSPREKEIIRLVCAGLPNKAISDVLAISAWTVGTYLKRVFAKLQVSSRAEMVARVLQEGLLDSNHRKGREVG